MLMRWCHNDWWETKAATGETFFQEISQQYRLPDLFWLMVWQWNCRFPSKVRLLSKKNKGKKKKSSSLNRGSPSAWHARWTISHFLQYLPHTSFWCWAAECLRGPGKSWWGWLEKPHICHNKVGQSGLVGTPQDYCCCVQLSATTTLASWRWLRWPGKLFTGRSTKLITAAHYVGSESSAQIMSCVCFLLLHLFSYVK